MRAAGGNERVLTIGTSYGWSKCRPNGSWQSRSKHQRCRQGHFFLFDGISGLVQAAPSTHALSHRQSNPTFFLQCFDALSQGASVGVNKDIALVADNRSDAVSTAEWKLQFLSPAWRLTSRAQGAHRDTGQVGRSPTD